jgi:hypothetical protein
MIPEIKEMKTWDEAARWLAKHGWGLALIEEQKAEWDKANTPKKPTATKPATKPTPKPEPTPTVEPKVASTAKTE